MPVCCVDQHQQLSLDDKLIDLLPDGAAARSPHAGEITLSMPSIAILKRSCERVW